MDQHIDAERLAAYMDGTLSLAERTAAEAHAADCPRCLHLLAAMVRSEESAPAKRPFWNLPVVRWSVPLLAGATALALWINVRSKTEMAPALPVPASQDASERGGTASAMAGYAESVAPVDSLKAQSAKSEEAKARADARSNRAKSQPEKEERSPQSPPPTTVTSAPTPAAASPNAAAVAAKPEMRRDLRLEDALTERAAARAAPAAVEIVSQDSVTRWRVVGKTIVRSTDGGATWNGESVAVQGELTAGSSPSPLVAWFIGRQGYVLVTSGGDRWRRVIFPETADLASVNARSEREAEVTTADGRVFATVDGGQSWTRR
jgi:cytoskeletal protein RodZ